MRHLLLGLGIFGIMGLSVSHAQAAAIVNGITVSPAIEQITLGQNQTTDSFNSEVTNNTGATISLNVSAENFTSLNQNGGINFYSSSQISAKDPHGLVDYLSVPTTPILLAPGQTQNVPVTIINANKLAAGGHYAALIFKKAGLTGNNVNNVTVNQAVSSLIFLSTYGGGTQNLALLNTVVGSITTTLPSAINTVFDNSGNTQSAPRGIVQVLDSSSKVISQGQINTGSSLILPQSTRLFTLTLTQVTKHVGPGIYKLRIMYRHDGQTNYTVYTKKFLYVNQYLITATIIIGFLVVVLVVRRLAPKSIYLLKK